jgi:hypothetical protein
VADRGIGEVSKGSRIAGSHELGSSQGESPKLGAPSHEVMKSRGARTTIGSREWEDHWIRNPSPIAHSEVQG